MTSRTPRGGHKGGHAQRFVSTRVATLPPGTYTDPGQPGLQLRVRAKGGATGSTFSRTWLLRIKYRGEETRLVLGHFPETSLDTARGEARKLREAAGAGIDPRRARPRRRVAPVALPAPGAPGRADARHSVEFLASEFMARHVKPTRKRPEYVQAILDRDVLKKWPGRDARTIEPAEVIELLDGIVDRGSRVAANRTAGVLSQMFRYGVHRRIMPASPVQLLYRPGGREKPRSRVLSESELRILVRDPLAGARLHRTAHAIMVLLATGQRRGELIGAKWADIDFDARTWRIPDENSKSGRGHVVPLSGLAVREFEALSRLANHSPYVMPDAERSAPLDAKQLTRSLAKCQKRFKEIGIGPFTLHDLRRTCRTGLAQLKIAPHIAERVLNHAQERIPGTYDVHDYLDEKREALDKWAMHLQGLRP